MCLCVTSNQACPCTLLTDTHVISGDGQVVIDSEKMQAGGFEVNYTKLIAHTDVVAGVTRALSVSVHMCMRVCVCMSSNLAVRQYMTSPGHPLYLRSKRQTSKPTSVCTLLSANLLVCTARLIYRYTGVLNSYESHKSHFSSVFIYLYLLRKSYNKRIS